MRADPACGSGPCPRKGGFQPPGGIPESSEAEHQQRLWDPAGRRCRPFACKQAPTGLARTKKWALGRTADQTHESGPVETEGAESSTQDPPVGAGPARERVALATRQRLPRRIPETLILPVFGAPYRRRGAMVVPSGIAQAIHGRSHLAIPGQIGPSRHHHCPAYFAAEPPRGRSTLSEKAPGPFNFPRSPGVGRSGEKGLWDPAGRQGRPFAGKARSHNPARHLALAEGSLRIRSRGSRGSGCPGGAPGRAAG